MDRERGQHRFGMELPDRLTTSAPGPDQPQSGTAAFFPAGAALRHPEPPGPKQSTAKRNESHGHGRQQQADRAGRPTPLTDEEFEELQKKDKRTSGILAAIVDFITGFFH